MGGDRRDQARLGRHSPVCLPAGQSIQGPRQRGPFLFGAEMSLESMAEAIGGTIKRQLSPLRDSVAHLAGGLVECETGIKAERDANQKLCVRIAELEKQVGESPAINARIGARVSALLGRPVDIDS